MFPVKNLEGKGLDYFAGWFDAAQAQKPLPPREAQTRRAAFLADVSLALRSDANGDHDRVDPSEIAEVSQLFILKHPNYGSITSCDFREYVNAINGRVRNFEAQPMRLKIGFGKSVSPGRQADFRAAVDRARDIAFQTVGPDGMRPLLGGRTRVEVKNSMVLIAIGTPGELQETLAPLKQSAETKVERSYGDVVSYSFLRHNPDTCHKVLTGFMVFIDQAKFGEGSDTTYPEVLMAMIHVLTGQLPQMLNGEVPLNESEALERSFPAMERAYEAMRTSLPTAVSTRNAKLILDRQRIALSAVLRDK